MTSFYICDDNPMKFVRMNSTCLTFYLDKLGYKVKMEIRESMEVSVWI